MAGFRRDGEELTQFKDPPRSTEIRGEGSSAVGTAKLNNLPQAKAALSPCNDTGAVLEQ